MKAISTALLLALSVAPAWAEQTDKVVVNDLDSTKKVAYSCSSDTDGKRKLDLEVMYGMKEGEVVVSQVKIGNFISPGMWRVPDTLLNRFAGKDEKSLPTMWTTLPATADDVDKVDGGKLSYSEEEGGVQTVIAEKCKLDKEKTAQLNR
ncbi:MAG: hypothetical protein Q4B82_08745 [Alysiella sp.]|uniref:hypothetical protein n=1 Tax=Alysiella sp. TaxID=1872483 RepID=UPI0026DD3174|nr:hypothetical protein [Alysiella sp.]MDO4434648.1 hypothetical protein [Alysiella sp.]